MQRYKGMEMRYFHSCDQVKRGFFNVKWHPGQKNLCDYQSNNHMGKHHVHMYPIYLHMKNSPEYLPQAMKPGVYDMVVGTPSLMGHMGVRTLNPHIQRIQVESLMGIAIISKSQRCSLTCQDSAIIADTSQRQSLTCVTHAYMYNKSQVNIGKPVHINST